VVRVANKMLRVVWYMLTRREPYGQGKEVLYKNKLMRMEKLASSRLA